MKKIVDYTLITISLVIAVIFYYQFDLDMVLFEKFDRPTVTTEMVEANRAIDYTGYIAGEDIAVVTNKEEWEKAFNDVEYISVTPKSIEKTDVLSRANWVEPYKRRRNGAIGKRLEDVRHTSLDITSYYIPYYIIELEDGTKIPAQMNRGIAKKIAQGEKITLPLGKKKGYTETAKKLLKSEYGDVETKYVLYTINDDWQGKNANRIMFEKIGISIAIFFFLAVVSQLLVDKFIFKED